MTAGPAIPSWATQSVRSCSVVATARSSSRVPFSTITTGVSGRAPAASRLRAHERRVADAHVDGERRAGRGQRRPVEVGRAVGGGAGHDRELPHVLAQRHGQADAGRAGMRRRHAGHHLDGDAGRLQRRHLLGGAAEDEGVAALEPGHDLAGLGLAHQDAVDLGLRRGGPAAASCRRRCARRRGGRTRGSWGSTRRSTTSTSASCRRCSALSVSRSGSPGPQPISATRPGAGLRPRILAMSSAARMRSASASAPLRTARRKGPCSSRSQRRRRARGSANGLGDALAQRMRALGQRAEVGRQQRLEPGLDLARQHRRGALGADRHRHRRAVDDGRRDEGGELGRIDDVDGDAAGPGGARHRGIEHAVAGRRIDEALAVQIARLEGARHDPDRALLARARAARR